MQPIRGKNSEGNEIKKGQEQEEDKSWKTKNMQKKTKRLSMTYSYPIRRSY